MILSLLVAVVGVFAFAPRVQAASCTTPSPSYGSVTLSTVSIPSDGTYSVWVRMKPATTQDNSVLLQVDTSDCFNVGGGVGVPAGNWTWVRHKDGNANTVIQKELKAGNHDFKLFGSKPGLAVDTILLSTDGNCIPTGFGENCSTNIVLPVGSSSSNGVGSSTPQASGTTNNNLADNTQTKQDIVTQATRYAAQNFLWIVLVLVGAVALIGFGIRFLWRYMAARKGEVPERATNTNNTPQSPQPGELIHPIPSNPSESASQSINDEVGL